MDVASRAEDRLTRVLRDARHIGLRRRAESGAADHPDGEGRVRRLLGRDIKQLPAPRDADLVDCLDHTAWNRLSRATRATVSLPIFDESGHARMKRDMDLVREIMLKVEALPAGPPVLYRMGEVEDLVLLNHLEMLIEAGLVRGKISRSQGSRGDVIGISTLTWEGHEWVDAVRDPRVWDEAKTTLLESGGSLSFELTKAVATRILRMRVGLPSG